MPKLTQLRRTYFALSACALLLTAFAYQRDARPRLQQHVLSATRAEDALPKRIFWIWERPEDLHAIDPAATGVAVLQQTIRLGNYVTVLQRHQPFILPVGTQRIAVVRIETAPDFATHHDDTALLHDTLPNLQHVAQQPNIAALQIDFDARRSERAFYRKLLTRLRQTMPPGLPLEITALVSWCSTDDWIRDLPVNAAIPMFFRMEPDRRRMDLANSPAYRVREPLCQSSLGVSTTEPWPVDRTGKRIFIFPDHGWTRDMSLLPIDLQQVANP